MASNNFGLPFPEDELIRCCLCYSLPSKTVGAEMHYLYDNQGSSNEIYEITVKYFDPMVTIVV